jgi:hypothetical protein
MIEIQFVTIDCAEPYQLAEWWSQATGSRIHPESEPGDEEVLIEGSPSLLFIKVPEGKTVKNRIHLDVVPSAGRTRDEEVERLLGLGAKPFEDHRKPDGTGWFTLLDPEANEFCVSRSQAERDAQL